jgi:hypothetical protein
MSPTHFGYTCGHTQEGELQRIYKTTFEPTHKYGIIIIIIIIIIIFSGFATQRGL